jgi:hypothetical protein
MLTRRDAICLTAFGLPPLLAGCGDASSQTASNRNDGNELNPIPLNSTCKSDAERLSLFAECMATYEMDRNAPDSEWPWNVISKRAVAYACGQIARDSDTILHVHDPEEFSRCKKLADIPTAIMHGCDVGMGSESSDPFQAYFRVATVESQNVNAVSEQLIREAFGGTIYPPTQITIEPLQEKGEWWQQVVIDGSGIGTYLEPWRKMIKWFQNESQLHAPAFVMIGDDPLDPTMRNGGPVFPRMAVAITKAGSLVGIGGWVVHT